MNRLRRLAIGEFNPLKRFAIGVNSKRSGIDSTSIALRFGLRVFDSGEIGVVSVLVFVELVDDVLLRLAREVLLGGLLDLCNRTNMLRKHEILGKSIVFSHKHMNIFQTPIPNMKNSDLASSHRDNFKRH